MPTGGMTYGSGSYGAGTYGGILPLPAPNPMHPNLQYRVQIRDHSLHPLGELTDLIDADMLLAFNDVGTFALTTRASGNPMRQYFAEGNGVIISRDRGDGSGAQTLFSGPIWHLERHGKDDTYVLAGVSDDFWLKARGAMPPVGQAYDTRSGVASTLLRGYVDANAGPSAPTPFPVPGLVLAADPLIGSTVNGNLRYDVLLTALQQLAISGGDLGFRVLQTDNGVLTFSIYQPATKSNAIFSRDLGNLLDFSYTLDGPAANYYTAAGGGDGASRTIVTGQDSASVSTWGVVWGFIDTRDTTDTTTMTQRINAQIAQDASQTNLSITPQDTPALQYGRDYNLGDVVNVQVDGETITDTIRQVHFQLNGTDQELITPGIGNAGNGQIYELFSPQYRALKAVQAKLHRLQAVQ